MKNWAYSHRNRLAGLLICVLMGGVELLDLLGSGTGGLVGNSPMGQLAQQIAAMFTAEPSLVRAGSDRARLSSNLVVAGNYLVVLGFSALFWLSSRQRPGRATAALLALQMALALSTMSALLYVLAFQYAVMFPLRRALAWLLVQMALLAAVLIQLALFGPMTLGDRTIGLFWLYGSVGLLVQAICFGIALLVLRERRARHTLAAANAALLATQSMLEDTVRSSERLRIARDLHDAVGHHLTALNLHLELALRQSGGDAPAALHTARTLASGLLAEVREVVSTERSDQRIDLQAAVATLCSGIPAPALHVRYDPSLEIASPALAHTLFFCIQEALTNAVRHAQATLVHIAVRQAGTCVLLEVSDDGVGARGAAEGNGLRGMRERVAALDGTLDVGGTGGMQLAISLPLSGRAA